MTSGSAPIRSRAECEVCKRNQMVWIHKSGYGECIACGDGAHNPNPAKHHECVCKVGHRILNQEPSGDARSRFLSCLPCPVNFYKLQDAKSDGAACRGTAVFIKSSTQHMFINLSLLQLVAPPFSYTPLSKIHAFRVQRTKSPSSPHLFRALLSTCNPFVFLL